MGFRRRQKLKFPVRNLHHLGSHASFPGSNLRLGTKRRDNTAFGASPVSKVCLKVKPGIQ